MAGTTRPAIPRMRYALDRGANSLSVSSTAIGIAAHSPLSDQLFRRDRQVTNPFANRMKDRIGDRCGDAGRAHLAYPFTAPRARFLVDLLDTVDRGAISTLPLNHGFTVCWSLVCTSVRWSC